MTHDTVEHLLERCEPTPAPADLRLRLIERAVAAAAEERRARQSWTIAGRGFWTAAAALVLVAGALLGVSSRTTAGIATLFLPRDADPPPGVREAARLLGQEDSDEVIRLLVGPPERHDEAGLRGDQR